MGSKLLCIALAAVVLVGCATKRYGRIESLSDVEQDAYTCEEIEIEFAKIAEFQKQIGENSKLDAASVGAWLVDYGLGNAMERNAASKSALKRQEALMQLAEKKGCE